MDSTADQSYLQTDRAPERTQSLQLLRKPQVTAAVERTLRVGVPGIQDMVVSIDNVGTHRFLYELCCP